MHPMTRATHWYTVQQTQQEGKGALLRTAYPATHRDTKEGEGRRKIHRMLAKINFNVQDINTMSTKI